MIIDPILKAGIARGVGAGLTFQHDRSAIGHDQAGPYQKHTRLTERRLGYRKFLSGVRPAGSGRNRPVGEYRKHFQLPAP